MKRILIALLVVSGLGAGAAAAEGCSEPRIDCTTGHGGFAARYTLKPGSVQGSGKCDKFTGEIIGLEKYNPCQEGQCQDGGTYQQDLTKATLAIQSQQLGQMAVDEETAGMMVDWSKVSSLGSFISTTPDDKDVCTVPTLAPAEISIPMMGTTPGSDIKYEWSNVRVRVTTAYEGTEMVADLKYTQDGCTAEYTVVGLWPAVNCEAADDMGNPLDMPDPGSCDPVADPDAGRAYGSGINPDFQQDVTCGRVETPTGNHQWLCMLKQPPDDLK